MAGLKVGALARTAAHVLSGGPLVTTRRLPRSLTRTFGRLHLLEEWDGETARYVRMDSDHGPLFVKYRYPLDFRERSYRQFTRERLYLEAFAPHVNVPHAALLHADQDDTSLKAHLVLRDLAKDTRTWGDFEEHERLDVLPTFMTLIARFHGEWAMAARLTEHPSFRWRPDVIANAGRERLAVPPDVPLPENVTALARALQAPGALEVLLNEPTVHTMTHGDLHFGQVLFGERDAYLLDFQQARVAPLGSDLAHLLGLRLSFAERRALQSGMLGTYRDALRTWNVDVNLDVELRVGAVLNFLSMWRRATREPTGRFRQLLVRVATFTRETGVTS